MTIGRMPIRAIFYDAGHTLVRPRPDFDEGDLRWQLHHSMSSRLTFG